MRDTFDLEQLNQFTDGSDSLFGHLINNWFYHTEGVQYLLEKTNCYWLVDEISLVLFPRLIKQYNGWFYAIHCMVKPDHSVVITVENGNNKVYFKHKIQWTDFPLIEKPIKFYLTDTGSFYCLMLASEY